MVHGVRVCLPMDDRDTARSWWQLCFVLELVRAPRLHREGELRQTDGRKNSFCPTLAWLPPSAIPLTS